MRLLSRLTRLLHGTDRAKTDAKRPAGAAKSARKTTPPSPPTPATVSASLSSSSRACPATPAAAPAGAGHGHNRRAQHSHRAHRRQHQQAHSRLRRTDLSSCLVLAGSGPGAVSAPRSPQPAARQAGSFSPWPAPTLGHPWQQPAHALAAAASACASSPLMAAHGCGRGKPVAAATAHAGRLASSPLATAAPVTVRGFGVTAAAAAAAAEAAGRRLPTSSGSVLCTVFCEPTDSEAEWRVALASCRKLARAYKDGSLDQEFDPRLRENLLTKAMLGAIKTRRRSQDKAEAEPVAVQTLSVNKAAALPSADPTPAHVRCPPLPAVAGCRASDTVKAACEPGAATITCEPGAATITCSVMDRVVERLVSGSSVHQRRAVVLEASC